ncbi:zinc finger E-box-binding homeobox 2-like [Sabethes cyaneus]|uniref:zinc finger E-box-binding homeobox 2-like n=1 Tax=Sabethes cyaneus TaxID=53552 RepID=UPI00237E63E7|nr:zinc finger E-box-binding homeobox 2-like [Sabethes cyaneus]
MDVKRQQTSNESQTKNAPKNGVENQEKGSTGRKCLMCLQSYEELGAIETESSEELKRIVDNMFKIAKIEISPTGGKVEPLCSSCRAKLGYDFDEDAYYEMLSQTYSETSPPSSNPTLFGNGPPAHTGGTPVEYPESPTGPLLDAACGTFVVTEFGRDEAADKSSDLKCVVCAKVFNFRSTLRLHIRSHYSTSQELEPQKPQRKPRMYECGECNISFKLKYDYDKHQAIHNRGNLFQCEICYKLFKHKSYYLMHRNAKRCKAVSLPMTPMNLSTNSVRNISPEKQLQEISTLSEGIRHTS